jgi:hypothetical protein
MSPGGEQYPKIKRVKLGYNVCLSQRECPKRVDPGFWTLALTLERSRMAGGSKDATKELVASASASLG